jgi:hypothetical protein
LERVAEQAFGEDKTMIEAQQQVIDMTPDPLVMPTAHDRGVTLFNRLVERLAKEEHAERLESAEEGAADSAKRQFTVEGRFAPTATD